MRLTAKDKVTPVRSNEGLTLDEFVAGLDMFERDVEQKVIKLEDTEFSQNGGWMLTLNGEKHLITPWAAKQLCSRIVGGLHAIFTKNPPNLNRQLMEQWLPVANKPEATAITLPRDGAEPVVLAFVDVERSNVFSGHLVRELREAFSGWEADCFGRFGSENQNAYLRLYDPKGLPGSDGDCSIGVNLVASDYGDKPMTVDLLLFRKVCSNGAIASYKRQPYFTTKYQNVTKDDITSMYGNAVARAAEDAAKFSRVVSMAQEKEMTASDMVELLEGLAERKGINKKLMINVIQEVRGGQVEESTMWGLANRVTSLAQSSSFAIRLRHERTVGSLLGMDMDLDVMSA